MWAVALEKFEKAQAEIGLKQTLNKTHVHVEAALKDIKKLHPLLLNISVEK